MKLSKRYTLDNGVFPTYKRTTIEIPYKNDLLDWENRKITSQSESPSYSYKKLIFDLLCEKDISIDEFVNIISWSDTGLNKNHKLLKHITSLYENKQYDIIEVLKPLYIQDLVNINGNYQEQLDIHEKLIEQYNKRWEDLLYNRRSLELEYKNYKIK